jgi:hypothetical protein
MAEKMSQATRVNMLRTITSLWGCNNLIKNKHKQIIKPKSQLNTILNDDIGRKTN